MTNNKSSKKQDLTRLLLAVIIIFLINFIASFLFTRFDLTSEKRFTLSKTTKEFAGKLKDVVYIKVYLDGDFPAGFKRLRNATKEMLDEFRVYSNGNIEYEFIDPSANPDQKERNKLYSQLADKGLQPTNLEEKGNSETSQKIIFPGAIFTYRSETFPLQLLKSQIGVAPEEMLNNSIQGLEYGIANTIKKLINTQRPKVGFLQGHGELDKMHLADITRALNDFYDVDSVVINQRLDALKDYNALIIAKPDSLFNEKDKFIIDQFIMKGGKVLWCLDAMYASMDSIDKKTSSTVGFAKSLNLEDQLFKYGVRVNPDLIEDVQSAPIPIVTGYIGNQPQQKLLPWYFFPLVMPTSNHPIVNNLNAIKCEFASSIDTIAVPDIKKTILLSSSQYSKLQYSPARISLNILRFAPDLKQFNKPNRPIAVLLEGKFSSVFTNRIPAAIQDNPTIGFKDKGIDNKMIVISDGDIIKNNLKKNSNYIYPLGYDRATGQTYGNKNFILNCIDYLCDDSGLIAIRSKELKLRLLNKNKVDSEKTMWQTINIALPLLLIIIYGIIQYYLRKKRFA